jgi:hypothetical protein
MDARVKPAHDGEFAEQTKRYITTVSRFAARVTPV